MIKVIQILTFAAILSSFAATAWAVPVDLDGMAQCSAGTQINGIDEADVTGNNGGSMDCWGTFDGNAPGPSEDGFETMGMEFEYLAKDDGVLDDPENIGLSVSPMVDGNSLSGTWAFTNGSLGADFLIVLKAANSPGYAVWVFDGVSNTSTSGDWLVAWNHGLSHLSVYRKTTFQDMPEPGTLVLLGAGLLGLGIRRWRRGSSL